MEHRGHALWRDREIRDRDHGPDHGAELLALHRARRDADWHSELHVLAALGRNIDESLELAAFALDSDHRRTDGQHRAGRDLDLKDAPFNRADDLGVLGQLSRRGIHLAASVIESKFRGLAFAFALSLQIGLLRSQFKDLVLGVFLSLLRVGEVPATLLESASRREPLRQQIVQIFDVDGQKVDAL